MNEQTSQQTKYDLKSVKLPYLAGLMLRLFVTLLESPFRRLIAPILLRNAGITWLREQLIDELPTLYPISSNITPISSKTKSVPTQELPDHAVETGSGFHFNTVHDYARAYQTGKTTPIDVVKKLLRAIEASDTGTRPLHTFISLSHEDLLEQAEKATERIEKGRRLSYLDGVPIAVKDQFEMEHHPTTFGTTFLGTSLSKRDSTIVARIRGAGAILIGKTNMHEMGMGVTGFNPHHGTTHNPYDLDRYTGGSSSGSAVAVAAGFCPAAIGADGGGSIRIPASFCGLVGLKPTFGRVSRFGTNPLGWSLDHFGPLAATTTDTALVYAVVAGPDQNDPMSLYQPAPTLSHWDNLELTDLTIGVYWPWFHHASADTVSMCQALLYAFEFLDELFLRLFFCLGRKRCCYLIAQLLDLVCAGVF